jgi:hypothetical protein
VKEINVIGKQVVEGVAEYKRQTVHCVGAFFLCSPPHQQLHTSLSTTPPVLVVLVSVVDIFSCCLVLSRCERERERVCVCVCVG